MIARYINFLFSQKNKGFYSRKNTYLRLLKKLNNSFISQYKNGNKKYTIKLIFLVFHLLLYLLILKYRFSFLLQEFYLVLHLSQAYSEQHCNHQGATSRSAMPEFTACQQSDDTPSCQTTTRTRFPRWTRARSRRTLCAQISRRASSRRSASASDAASNP